MLKPEEISIENFKIIEGQINSPFEFNNDLIKSHKFEVSLKLAFNIDDKLAMADFTVEIETQSDGNKEEARGFFHFIFLYRITNLEELVTLQESEGESDESSAICHASLGNALSSITYSTSRGILMTRFQGTALKDFILPVKDPNDLL